MTTLGILQAKTPCLKKTEEEENYYILPSALRWSHAAKHDSNCSLSEDPYCEDHVSKLIPSADDQYFLTPDDDVFPG